MIQFLDRFNNTNLTIKRLLGLVTVLFCLTFVFSGIALADQEAPVGYDRCEWGPGWSEPQSAAEKCGWPPGEGRFWKDCCCCYIKSHIHDLGYVSPAFSKVFEDRKVKIEYRPGLGKGCSTEMTVYSSVDGEDWKEVVNIPVTQETWHPKTTYQDIIEVSGKFRFIKISIPHCYNDYSSAEIIGEIGPVCGNRVVEQGEECDGPGSYAEGFVCTKDCKEVSLEKVEGPDLEITDVKFGNAPLENGEPTTITAVVENKGNEPISGGESIDAHFYLNGSIGDEFPWEIGLSWKSLDKDLNPEDEIEIDAQLEWSEELLEWITIPVYNEFEKNFYVEIDEDDYFKEINEHNNIYFKDIPISDTGFTIDPDSYRFKNFGEVSEKEESLFTTFLKNFASPETLFAGAVPLIAGSYQEFVGHAGHCYGMSSTSILYYMDWLDKPVNKETIKMTREDKGVEQRIAEYQYRQLSNFLKYLLSGVKKDVIPGLDPDYEKRIYDRIKSTLDEGSPIMLTTKDHAMVAFDTYQLSEDRKLVLLYDNNEPGKAIIADFDFEDKGIGIGDLENLHEISKATLSRKSGYDAVIVSPYLTDDNYVQGLVTNGVQSFVNGLVDVGEEGYDILVGVGDSVIDGVSSLADWGGKILSFGSPVDVTLIDEKGRKINEKINEIPGARLEIKNGTKIFYLPQGIDYSAKIEGYDKGDLEVKYIIPTSKNTVNISTIEKTEVTEKTKGSLDLKAGTSKIEMALDLEGDGTEDKSVEAKVQRNISVEDYPVKVEIKDSEGRVLSSETNQIPEARKVNRGEVSIWAIPQDLDYSVKMKAADKCDFTLSKGTSSKKEEMNWKTFKEVSLDRKAELSLNGELEIDSEGDGEIDKQISAQTEKLVKKEISEPPIPGEEEKKEKSFWDRWKLHILGGAGIGIVILIILIIKVYVFPKKKEENEAIGSFSGKK